MQRSGGGTNRMPAGERGHDAGPLVLPDTCRDRLAEGLRGRGGLNGAARDDVPPVATVGLHGGRGLDLDLGLPVFRHGLLRYRHAFGEVGPTALLTLRSTGASFVAAGLPIARDALVAEAGLSLHVGPNSSLGVSYTGQIGQRAEDHATKGTFTYGF